MKPIYFLLFALIGVNTSFAQTSNDESRTSFIKHFIQAQSTNDVASLRTMFVKNPLISMPARSGKNQIGKSDFFSLLKKAGVEQQNCNSSFEVLSATETNFTAQVRFVYLTYAFQHLIKAEKQEGAWKITELHKSFLEPSSPALVIR